MNFVQPICKEMSFLQFSVGWMIFKWSREKANERELKTSHISGSSSLAVERSLWMKGSSVAALLTYAAVR